MLQKMPEMTETAKISGVSSGILIKKAAIEKRNAPSVIPRVCWYAFPPSLTLMRTILPQNIAGRSAYKMPTSTPTFFSFLHSIPLFRIFSRKDANTKKPYQRVRFFSRSIFISSILYGRCLLYLCAHTYVHRNSHAALELSSLAGRLCDSYRSKQVHLTMKEQELLAPLQVK